MRESLRGYALGVMSLAEKSDKQVQVIDELRSFCQVLRSQELLAEIISDPSIPSRKRQAILAELLSSRVDGLVLQLIEAFVGTENPRAISDSIFDLSRMLSGEGDIRLDGGFTTSGRATGFAQALLESLESNRDLEQVEEELFRFARIVEANVVIRKVLSGIGSDSQQRAELATALLSGESHVFTLEIVVFVARTDRLRDIVQFLDETVVRAAQIRERKIAKVRSATELTKAQVEQLSAALERVLGSKVEVRTSVDPSLIGGVVAVVGDTVFDGSVRNKIEQLRVRLGLPATVKSRERI